MASLDIPGMTGLTENNSASQGSTLDTGDLRRRFGMPRTSELSFKRDPWFYLMSTFRKKSQTDPEYKYFEKRSSLARRYAYVIAHGATTISAGDATLSTTVGATHLFRLATDYKSEGNIPNLYDGVSSSARSAAFAVGAAGTIPKFFIAGQIININVGSTIGGGGQPTGYYTALITNVVEVSDTYVEVTTTIKSVPVSGDTEICAYASNVAITDTYATRLAKTKTDLVSKQTHVIGTSFAAGTGYPAGWQDNPYSSGFAYMQIFKTALEMDEEMMATVFKHDPNEWMRLWADKLIEHNLDIERALHFSSQGKSGKNRQCQGFVDYLLNYSPMYSIDLDTATSDDFLHDITNFTYAGSEVTLDNMIFLADTPTYNWLNLLGGLLKNNVNIDSSFRYEMENAGKARAGLLDVSVIKTAKGNINLVEDVHLNNSPLAIAGLSLDEVEISPLVGNGKNRDTAVYAGVQSLEKDGIDAYASLIQTQLGQCLKNPEKHVSWLKAQ